MTDVITLEDGEVLDIAAYPLPDGIEDQTFNRELMARAMDVSVVTITKWIDEGMPVLQRGGNGQSYEFLFSQCYAWRLWREGRDAASRQAKLSNANQMAMLFLGQEDTADRPNLTPKEVREWSEAELIRNKAAEQRGELVRTAHVTRVLDNVLSGARNAIANAPDWLEQEFSLGPHQVEKSQTYFDGLLDEMRHQIIAAGFKAAPVLPLAPRAQSQTAD